MASYKIGPAQAGDIPTLVDLLNDLFGVELDFTSDTSRQARGLESLIAEAGKSDRLMLAVARDEQGAVIAMGSAQLVISTAEGASSAWLEDIVVHPDYRRQGIGKQLLEHLVIWAKTRGATRAQLVTDKDNAGADLFYSEMGWQATQLAVRRRFIE
jgi:GNAT superfamily N-acetyltransferase